MAATLTRLLLTESDELWFDLGLKQKAAEGKLTCVL